MFQFTSLVISIKKWILSFLRACERNEVCCEIKKPPLTHKLKTAAFIIRKIKIVVTVKSYLTIVLTPTFFFFSEYSSKRRRDEGWHLLASVELHLSRIQVKFKRNGKAVIICKKAQEENGKTKPFMPQLTNELQDLSYFRVKSIGKRKKTNLIIASHLLQLLTLYIVFKREKCSVHVVLEEGMLSLRHSGFWASLKLRCPRKFSCLPVLEAFSCLEQHWSHCFFEIVTTAVSGCILGDKFGSVWQSKRSARLLHSTELPN